MSRQALLTLSALAALCVLAMLSIQARAAGQTAGQAASQEGMVVVRDPQTGQIRKPTADEMKALRAATPPNASLTARQNVPPGMITRPNGARGVRVGESRLVYDVVTRGADGKLSSQCVQGEAAAQRALSHPANAGKESDDESR